MRHYLRLEERRTKEATRTAAIMNASRGADSYHGVYALFAPTNRFCEDWAMLKLVEPVLEYGREPYGICGCTGKRDDRFAADTADCWK